MKIEEQVLTIQQARHLQKLGLDMSDAALGWYPVQIGITDDGFPMYSEKEFTIHERDIDGSHNVPTYTMQELWEKLPNTIICDGIEFFLLVDYQNDKVSYSISIDDLCYIIISERISGNILKALYDMLCQVIENEYLKEEKK